MKQLIKKGKLWAREDTVCFTGHRPKDIYPKRAYSEMRRDDYQKIVDRIKDQVCLLYEDGCRRFLTGGAQGFDQLAFWAVQSVKSRMHPDIQNILVLPFEGQDAIWSPVGLFSQEEYAKMKRTADEIIICAEVNGTSSDAAGALMYRNEVMVSMAETVVGMAGDSSWESEKARGGTAHCLRYAKAKHRRIITKSFL